MTEILLTMHIPGTSHWAQLATKIKVNNIRIVVVFIIVQIIQGMSPK